MRNKTPIPAVRVLPMPKERMVFHGRALRDLRESKDVSRAELGLAVGVSREMIRLYEDEGRDPPASRLAEILLAIGVPVHAMHKLFKAEARNGS